MKKIFNKIPAKPPSELAQLIVDVLCGKVYCSELHLKDKMMLAHVFLPLKAGVLADWTDDALAEIGCIYQYLDQAIPGRLVHGEPMFDKAKLLHVDDWKQVMEAVTTASKEDDSSGDRDTGQDDKAGATPGGQEADSTTER